MFHLLLAVIYLAFISLGLPDSLLGSAWPSMYPQFQVPVSHAGILSMIIAGGTIVSSLNSDRLTRKLGAGKVTAMSVALTAAALLGFSFSSSFFFLCLLAVPYGIGAGGVDAALNNYVALHYSSSHMSWLHCMWGVGASAGPYIMGYALSSGQGWNMGYRYISFLQIGLTFLLVLSLPLWKQQKETPSAQHAAAASRKPLSWRQVAAIPGAREILITFFCYCALEQTAMLWSASYFVLHLGLSADTAASFASLFFLGITLGRGISGFVAMKLDDTRMIRLGQGLILAGIVILLLPITADAPLAGLFIIGLGCAPVYPCVIHSTPARFGSDKSQAVIGIQMASAYAGTCLMPPVFGLIANNISIRLFPVFLAFFLVLMFLMHERMLRKTAA